MGDGREMNIHIFPFFFRSFYWFSGSYNGKITGFHTWVANKTYVWSRNTKQYGKTKILAEVWILRGFGGGGGIRTHVTLPSTRFRGLWKRNIFPYFLIKSYEFSVVSGGIYQIYKDFYIAVYRRIWFLRTVRNQKGNMNSMHLGCRVRRYQSSKHTQEKSNRTWLWDGLPLTACQATWNLARR